MRYLFFMFSKFSLFFLSLQPSIYFQMIGMEKDQSHSISKISKGEDVIDYQEESMLCQMPDFVLGRIVHYLGRWSQINKLGRCCKLLDRELPIFSKPIKINCWRKYEDKSLKEFFPQLEHLISRIANRPGHHPITIDITENNLERDKKALSEFLKFCSSDSISRYIQSLYISYNKLTSLPPEIAGLKYLKDLRVGENPIENPEDLLVVTKLPYLEKLSICCIGLKQLPDEMRRLEHLKLLDMSVNRFDKTIFKTILSLKNLESVDLSDNELTLDDVYKNMSKHSRIKDIKARNLDLGAYDSSLKIKWASKAIIYF